MTLIFSQIVWMWPLISLIIIMLLYIAGSLRVAVLAQPQGGTVHNLRTEYSKRNVYDSNSVGIKKLVPNKRATYECGS